MVGRRAASLAETVQNELTAGLQAGYFSGCAASVRIQGERAHVAIGTLSYSDRSAVTRASLFDIASITKSYVAVAAMRLAERGVLDLDAPVSEVLSHAPSCAASFSARDLLSHRAGLAPTSELWKRGAWNASERLTRVLQVPTVAHPRSRFIYSCLGYIWLGAMLEAVVSAPLDEIVKSEVADPLCLSSTAYGPRPRCETLATECQPYLGRGMVQGEVHDELCWWLGGVTGNAGLFSSAEDVLAFAESFEDSSLLSRASIDEMLRDHVPAGGDLDFGHGLGVRIADAGSIGSSAGFGHTGFTGTMWFADPQQSIAVALLTNRVHPRRDRISIRPFRARFLAALQG